MKNSHLAWHGLLQFIYFYLSVSTQIYLCNSSERFVLSIKVITTYGDIILSEIHTKLLALTPQSKIQCHMHLYL